MLHDLPDIDAWKSHVGARFQSAKEVGLIADSAVLAANSSRIFVPDDIDPSELRTALPQDSFRALRGEIAPRNQWVQRGDTFAEASTWLIATHDASVNAELFCEAGFRDAHDVPPVDLRQVIHEGRPFFTVSLSSTGADLLCKVFRRGRSTRVLATVRFVSASIGNGIEAVQGQFVCDALDLDTLIVSDFAGKAA